MSYFHTRMRTIIGAEAFHGPVRDGKEWFHLAMVIRRNWWVAGFSATGIRELTLAIVSNFLNPNLGQAKVIGSSRTGN